VALIASALCALLACQVGQGSGSATGTVTFPECHLDGPIDLHPDFFVGDFVQDPVTPMGAQQNMLTIRMQHGSYGEWSTDGISILVRDVDAIHGSSTAPSMLGTPITVGAGGGGLVDMTLYLGGTCPSGVPRSDFFTVPAILSAASGTITFSAIYAPDIDPANLHIAATFSNVVFLDATDPMRRHAELSGDLAFFYQRGRPAQRFP
jgi:hypothetical protein